MKHQFPPPLTHSMLLLYREDPGGAASEEQIPNQLPAPAP